MNKLIVDTLKPLKIPTYWIKKPQDKQFPVITFNYFRSGIYSNDKRELYEYNVTLNYVDKDLKNILIVKDEIISLFASVGINVSELPTTYEDKTDSYLTVLEFNYVM